MLDSVVIVGEGELDSATIGTIDGGGTRVRHFADLGCVVGQNMHHSVYGRVESP